jgi:N-acetylglucosamine repressor
MKKATRQFTKEHNIRLVLMTIFQHDNLSRADIARITDLTPTTVSDIVADLIEEGLVNETGIGASLGGKPPIQVSLVEDSRCLIGLDLTRDKFYGAIVNLRGKIREMADLPVANGDSDMSLAPVYEILDRLMAAASQRPVGIGVGTPGLVNTQEGVVIDAVNLNWKNLPLGQLLQERYGVPAYVLNDSQAAAIGEFNYGDSHSPDSNLVVINVRHGIGAGIIINGQLFQGDSGAAGEIGHVVVVREGGLPCRCGNLGCLETVASVKAVVLRAQMMASYSPNSALADSPSHGITLDSLEKAFNAGDTLARQVILEAGHFMGLGIASLVGTLNIHKVVLAGDMTRFGQPWLNAIQETLCQATLPRLAQDTQVEIGKLGKNNIILGASAMLLNNYSLLFKNQAVRQPNN